jgi:CHAP domain
VARTIGARVARIARRENGNDACAHGGFFSSCVNHEPNEEWCSDFARWVWHQARALYTDELTAAAGSFGAYGHKHGSGLHDNPRVGDAVLFNYDGGAYADHVAIVVRVFPNGYIRSIGGNEVTGDFHSSYVHRDYYSGATGYSAYWNYSISGYVSPVEDDMPYTKNQIRNLVKQGVRRELKNGPITRTEIKELIGQELNAANGVNAKLDKLIEALAKGG